MRSIFAIAVFRASPLGSQFVAAALIYQHVEWLRGADLGRVFSGGGESIRRHVFVAHDPAKEPDAVSRAIPKIEQ